ncbi:hypothetical protein [Mucilaginibacter sp. KACC 22063]|uniref:hypothetical protein n=1 Tax=Mucilaginibacter sp. KACC 22063 TaxID=3025666 RepID=UPI0023662FC6|nr:hypothetical protein [Mucilaginibacter sp. KACC 22063]WDF56450.1 hypothetical protein PQ461_05220 [Mucilaginibacter sp. KACC 22063]
MTKLAVLNQDGVISTVTGILGGIAFFIYVGLVLSIPSWLLLWLSTFLLLRSKQRNEIKRVILTAVALVLSFLPFCLFLGRRSNEFDSEPLGWLVIYASIIVCGIWLYKLPVVEE